MKKLLHDLNHYCENLTSPPGGKILYDLERETNLKTLAPQMLSGRIQGQLLSMISLMMKPQSILEVGTFTGYAAHCLASGLSPDGRMVTIEANPEMEWLIRKYLERADLNERVELIMGNALEVIPTLEGSFDLVFMDAGKRDYAQYFDLLIDRMLPGGIILADNTLWGGKVVDPKHQDVDTRIMRDFNQMIQDDERVENVILPFRDGLTVIRKK